MLEGILVGFLENVDIQLTTEEQVLIHGLGSDFTDLALSELKEGIASGSGCLDGTRDAQFSHLAELLEKVLELSLVETFWQVTNIEDATTAVRCHLQLVESARQSTLTHLRGRLLDLA